MHFKMSSAICSSLDQSKILLFGNGLNVTQMMEFVVERLENIAVNGENAGNKQ